MKAINPNLQRWISKEKFFLLFVMLFAFSGLIGCTSEADKKESVLATVGDFEVTEDHFVAAFQRFFYQSGRVMEPNFQNKKSILETELRTYVLATYAMELGLDKKPDALKYRGMMERKAFAEEYLERVILDTVTVTDEDARQLFLRFNTVLRASHLYAADKATADSLHTLLLAGASFEKLASEIFQNAYLAESGGDIGEFSVDDMDVAFEDAAFSLKVGEISAPVKTNQGYSIVKLTDRYTRPIITEYEYASKKSRFEDFAAERNREHATRNHLEATVQKLNVDNEKIRVIWESVRNSMSTFLTDEPESATLGITLPFSDDTVLASYNGFQFTAADLLKEGYYTPIDLRNRITAEHRFENFVKGLIYRSYVIDEFMKTPHRNDPLIAQSVDHSFYIYLNQRVLEEMRSQVSLSENELRAEFSKNRHAYDFPLMMNVAEIAVTTEQDARIVLNKLRKGTPFTEVLRQHTIDNEALATNGVQGLKTIQQYGSFAHKIRDLEEGEFSEPIEYHSGRYLVYKVLDRIEPREAAFDEVRHIVESALREIRLAESQKQIIEDVKRRYNAYLNEEKLREITIKL